ncbi:hypothetical protein VNO80_16650 [Phaseolus coccineus]|uniref:Methyltransferase n=1 Tax=Phaseolus coccineus TaxID=3886 RepID=A0AAN9R0D0_PHACN
MVLWTETPLGTMVREHPTMVLLLDRAFCSAPRRVNTNPWFSAARNPVCNLALMVGTTDIPDWCYVETYGTKGRGKFTEAPSAEDLTLFYRKFPISHLSKAKVETLGSIYERGLIGIYHDWCEAMFTYPRTYDLIHADSVLSLYSDRHYARNGQILRPEGCVIIRDDVDMLVKVKSIVNGLEWDSINVDHEDGHLKREKLLFVVKKY